MKQPAIAFILGGAVGTMLGLALGFFIFPFVFPPPKALEPPPPPPSLTAEAQPLASGFFIQADPDNNIPYGRGRVTVYDTTLRLEADFVVSPGPGYHVYLVMAEEVRGPDDMAQGNFVDLGKLRAFKGSQNYAIPEDVYPEEYSSVVIWSKQSGILISPANLDFGG